MESWLPIKEFEGYFVSNLGRIKSHNRARKPRILLGSEVRGGYLSATLYKNFKPYRFPIHCLVLATFVGPKLNKMQTCHLDGNPKNNKLSNLIYGTSKENHAHRRFHGTNCAGEKHPMHKLNKSQVLEIRKNHIKYSRGKFSARYFAEKYKVHEGTIGRIVNAKTWNLG